MKRLLVLALGAGVLGGCHCGGGVQNVPPQLGVSPPNLDFGFVKLDGGSTLPFTLSAQTQTPVQILSITLSDATAGGAAAFSIPNKPPSVAGQSSTPVGVVFTPTAVQQYGAIVTITSNDPKVPTTQVSLTGQGANPQIAVAPQCPTSCQGSADAGACTVSMAGANCQGSVSAAGIDFGTEPLVRQFPVPANELPGAQISNVGNVPLTVSKLDIEGADAAAFTFIGNPTLPLVLAAGTAQTATLRFVPTSSTQTSYSAQLVVGSDDPAHPILSVALTGQLRPHRPPVVCANLTHVVPSDGSAPLDYSSPQIWATLVPAPPTGYDFTTNRNVEPRSVISFSALSNANDPTTCTTDPDDQRTGLKFQWSVIAQPAGSTAAIGSATTPTPTMAPVVTGTYTVQFTATDAEGYSTSTTLTFDVVLKRDLVVQLSWNTPDGGYPGVDLDLHLIRPSSADAGDPFSGAFSYFNEGPTGMTSGDINGKSSNQLSGNPGFNFAWGDQSIADAPTLDADDTGSGPLVENIALNYPENDPLCANQSCDYKVMVHYFQDHRIAGSPPQCTVSAGCLDGDPCSCGDPTTACVANTADAGQPATGSGLCYVAPTPEIRVYVKANPVPRAVIPLDTLAPPNPVPVGAPCEIWYVADVIWPSKAFVADAGPFTDGGFPAQVIAWGADAGRIVSPLLSRFGQRQPGGLACSPDIIQGNSITPNWYGPEPR